MRRRDVLRGIGVLTGGVAVGGAVSTVDAQRGTVVQQVVDDGVPQPQSVLAVDLSADVDVVDAERVRVWTYIVDPRSARTRPRLLDVLEATATPTGVRLVVDGPVSRGTVVVFDEAGLVVDGRPRGAFAYTPDGDLLPPERATQWFKAYEPTNPDYFSPAVYPDGSPHADGDDDPDRVRERLAAHLGQFVDRGRLTAEERDRALARFDDPDVRSRFEDGEGEFDAEALAGVLANAGTVARGVDRVIIDGENQFGRPYAVQRRPTISGGCMEVLVEEGNPTVLVDPVLDGEPFVVLAPLFAHEGFHQDLAVGLDEEIIATYLETLVWAEHVLADPAVARTGTAKARRANTMLLVALNSGGRSFPDVGLYAAPHRQPGTNATPDAPRSVADFFSLVESKYARTPSEPSPGNAYARQVIARVTESSASALGFDSETLTRLDERTRVFSAADVGDLLAALELRPAPSVTTDAVVTPDPVAVADAREAGDRVEANESSAGESSVERERIDACGTCLRAGVEG
ncbi:hypothetical protein C2R22_01535 [Salinigranum rubrum]|uniref:Uncharacterized protein n=1 Tax=Salinigranum rubrum TaxID=755307 RepID=A0A2I8VEY9_9EURY|nr:hypothetical protein [Salinigranum rubrum]AUV80500.1 hypothetical protein C2R22_01535 [Salinigranum rubrum]